MWGTLPHFPVYVGRLLWGSGTSHGIHSQNTRSFKLQYNKLHLLWKCVKDNCQDYPRWEYIGMTTGAFKKIMSEHRYYPKRDVSTEPSGEHSTQRGHSVANLKEQGLEKVKSKDSFALKARESFLIRKFDTFNSWLNKELVTISFRYRKCIIMSI